MSCLLLSLLSCQSTNAYTGWAARLVGHQDLIAIVEGACIRTYRHSVCLNSTLGVSVYVNQVCLLDPVRLSSKLIPIECKRVDRETRLGGDETFSFPLLLLTAISIFPEAASLDGTSALARDLVTWVHTVAIDAALGFLLERLLFCWWCGSAIPMVKSGASVCFMHEYRGGALLGRLDFLADTVRGEAKLT